MTIGSRINELLAERNMSQAELARRVGMRQSSMNSLVNGKSRSSRFIVSIARELGTTAAFLNGDTDDPTVEIPEDFLTADERRMLRLSRRLSKEDQLAIGFMIERLAGAASPTLHDRQQEFRGEEAGDDELRKRG